MAQQKTRVTVEVSPTTSVTNSRRPNERIARVTISPVGNGFVRRQNIIDKAELEPGMRLFMQSGTMYLTGGSNQTGTFLEAAIAAAETSGYEVTNKK